MLRVISLISVHGGSTRREWGGLPETGRPIRHRFWAPKCGIFECSLMHYDRPSNHETSKKGFDAIEATLGNNKVTNARK